jgi:DNA-binding CsgD family transcriptional regulator
METRVLLLLSAGQSIPEVAAILGKSPRTIETHAESAKRKLGARNRASMVAIAYSRGILKPGSLARAEVVIAAAVHEPMPRSQ